MRVLELWPLETHQLTGDASTKWCWTSHQVTQASCSSVVERIANPTGTLEEREIEYLNPKAKLYPEGGLTEIR